MASRRDRSIVCNDLDLGAEAEEDDFVRRFDGDIFIEPVYGFAISGSGSLISEGLYINTGYEKPVWRVAMPSPIEFRAVVGGKLPVREVGAVISLRHLWEWNYFHFYHEVLGELRLLDLAGIDRSVPIVLGRFASQLPFPKQILDTGALRDRNWIIQDDRYLRASSVIFAGTQRSSMWRLDYLLDEMGIPREGPTDDRRVFLTRTSGRLLVNQAAVHELVASYGFEIRDTADMPINEQIELFTNARYLAAIHGAGLINIIYRRKRPMSILELHADWVSRSFLDIARENGYHHARLRCAPESGGAPVKQSMTVDLAQLEDALVDLLAS